MTEKVNSRVGPHQVLCALLAICSIVISAAIYVWAKPAIEEIRSRAKLVVTESITVDDDSFATCVFVIENVGEKYVGEITITLTPMNKDVILPQHVKYVKTDKKLFPKAYYVEDNVGYIRSQGRLWDGKSMTFTVSNVKVPQTFTSADLRTNVTAKTDLEVPVIRAK